MMAKKKDMDNLNVLCNEMINVSVPKDCPLNSKISDYKAYCQVYLLQEKIKKNHMTDNELAGFSSKVFGLNASYQVSTTIISYIVMGLCFAISSILLYPITIDIVNLFAYWFGIDLLNPPIWFAIVSIVLQIIFFLVIVFLLVLLMLWIEKRKTTHDITNSMYETLMYAKNLNG